MAAIVYLNLDGNAEQAIEFYSEALSATEVKKVKFGDIPQDPNYPMPENELNMIMESSIEFAGGKIMMSDILPSMKAITGELVKGNNILISLVMDDKKNWKNTLLICQSAAMSSCRYPILLGLRALECWLINSELTGNLIATQISFWIT